MSAPTTRRYPRSLAQAFPKEHCNPIEHYPASPARRMLRWVVLLGLSAFVGWLAAQGG